MRMRRWLAALAGLLPLSVCAQSAPLWRSVDIARQLRDTQPMRVRVQYRAGRVDVRPTSEPLLYSMHLRYDERRAVPLHHYDAEQHSVALGLESGGQSTHAMSGNREAGELRLALPMNVPLELDLDLGGTQSTFDLGDMSLQSVRLECGATDATLLFSRPNRRRMRDLDINVGAAAFSAVHLGNANADQMRIRGGVGSVDLDFSGVWTHDLAVNARLLMGSLTLRVPADVGLRLEVQRFVTGFDHPGLEKRGDAWYTPNYDSAPHKLQIHAEAAIGQIEVVTASR